MADQELKQWVLLLRGINVGGKKILLMKDLRALLGTWLGYENVKTYIQSGNCVFESADSATNIANTVEDEIEERHGFRPKALVMPASIITQALENSPYPQMRDTLKSIHFYFISQPELIVDKEAILQALEELRAPTEEFELQDRVFYLYAPHGIGRSKLASSVERALGVSVTARNLRTTLKIAEMVA